MFAAFDICNIWTGKYAHLLWSNFGIRIIYSTLSLSLSSSTSVEFHMNFRLFVDFVSIFSLFGIVIVDRSNMRLIWNLSLLSKLVVSLLVDLT